VWVIGLDGASFELIRPWVKAGELPTFERLMHGGAHGVLRSPVPQSPPAWASFITGCNPGKHGLYEWTQPRRGSYEVDLACGAMCRSQTLSHILSEQGRTVGVVNVPMTYPPEDVNGFMISGFDTPYGNTKFTYPPDLYDELQRHWNHYTILPIIVGVPLRQTAQNFHETINQREQVMYFLMERYDPEFFMLVFNATDSLQHLCLQSYSDNGRNAAQLECLRSIYKRLDAVLAGLIEKLPDDTSLLVVSDHGGRPLRSYIHLDHWLAQQGWLRYASDSPALANQRRRARLVGGAMTMLKAAIPQGLKARLRTSMGNLHTRMEKAATASLLDWAHTKAYSASSQGVYINLKGRQPHGTVEPGREYEDLQQRITEALMKLRDPNDGEPVVARVYKKEELFRGPYLDLAPDLYIHWREDAYLSWSNTSCSDSQLFTPPRALEMEDIVPDEGSGTRIGCHRQEGILLMYGDKVRSGIRIENAQIVDVAPTILALMGEPIPMEMDGRALTEALEEVYLNAVPFHRVAGRDKKSLDKEFTYSDEESKLVEERLRELGYL
jgi:predicted AlkP superfamily phosphohydrolase/phosphomutase